MNMKQRGFEIISKYLEEGLSVPQRATKGAAGYEFQAAETDVVPSLW
ncbi:dUTP diphosphatase, partial [Enterococcus faecalis]